MTGWWLAILTAAVLLISVQSQFCPSGFPYLYGSSCFSISTEATSWYNAQTACRNRGAKLAEPRTISVNNNLRDLVESRGLGCWLGGTDADREGHWRWASDKRGFTYKTWAPSQPDNFQNNEDCLHFSVRQDYWWNDLPCVSSLCYICEAELCPSLPTFLHGSRTCTNTNQYNMVQSVCTFSCDEPAYKLIGSKSLTCRAVYPPRWSASQPDCHEACSWVKNHCWPGECSLPNKLADSCRCRDGFRKRPGNATLCDPVTPADISTCRMSVTDAKGTSKNSSFVGNLTNCRAQRHEAVRTQPAELYFVIKADLATFGLGQLPHYVPRSLFGVVGAQIALVKINLRGTESTVYTEDLHGAPRCTETADSDNPVSILDCEGTINVSSTILQDGERLCADVKAFSGGFYDLLDERMNRRGRVHFPPYSNYTKRICFNYDETKPSHCSQAQTPCTSKPLQLSTRLTRTPEIQVHMEGWFDPVPLGGTPASASQIDRYRLELHNVHVNTTDSTLYVEDGAIDGSAFEWDADVTDTSKSYDVNVTLPEEGAARLYAVILEVHDHAGNVAYARRLVLFDNTSTVELLDRAPLEVVTANANSDFRWQTNVSRNVCVGWREHFINSELYHNNFLQPVRPDTAREIEGQYDQLAGTLPVSGTDNVNGIVKFEMAWSRDYGPRTSLEEIPYVYNQTACLREPITDGQTYDVWIRATDIMDNYREDSVRVSIDHTGPVMNMVGLRGRFGRDGLYVHNTKKLSAMFLLLHAEDPHSGLLKLQWKLGTQHLADDVGTGAVGVQRLDNTTDCNGTSNCYCPSVGVCEIHEYLISFSRLGQNKSHTGQHHRQYYITVTATNHAMLHTRQTVEILLDASPPSAGVVLEGLDDDDKAEMDFTSSRTVHVRWHGFLDHESGVLMYRVALAPRCLTDQEMDDGQNTTEVDGKQTTASFEFPSEGQYFTTVVAYNGAMEPSAVACSDGITYDTTPPRLVNVTLTHARSGQYVACTKPDELWLVNSNMTRVRLASTQHCLALCAQHFPAAAAAAADPYYLPMSSNHTVDLEPSDHLCRTLAVLREDWPIVLPSDYIRLAWRATDAESEMEEYYVGLDTDRSTAPAPDLLPFTPTHGHTSYHARHSGLGHGDLFYVFLRAVSKAGLHADVMLGPITIDVTPPDVTQTFAARVEEDYLVVTWNESAFVDPEQPEGIDLDVTFRVGYDSTFVTPFLSIPESDFSACQMHNVTGCARYPLSALYAHGIEDGRPFFFQLHVTNRAGHVTSVNTSSVQLPPHLPPSHAVVIDVTKSESSGSDDNDTYSQTPGFLHITEDVDVIVQCDEICVAWHGLYHKNEVSIEVGVGTSPTLDDLVPFMAVENRSPACINISSLPVYDKLHSLVRATSPGGSEVFSSDGFQMIPVGDPANRLQVFNGRSCTSVDIVGTKILTPGMETVDLAAISSLPLHTGDLVFVTLTPFIQHVQFPDTVMLQTTLAGYQLVHGSSRLTAVLPAPVTASTTVQVEACLKNAAILPVPQSYNSPFNSRAPYVHLSEAKWLKVKWELEGPWASLAKPLKVEALDESCMQTSPKKDKYRHQYCLLGETSVSLTKTEALIPAEGIIEDHQYATSVAVCFDDSCLPAVKSFLVTFSSAVRTVTFNQAAILAQSTSDVEVEIAAEIVPYEQTFLGNSSHPSSCVFRWTVAKERHGALPLTDWNLGKSASCTNMEVHETVNFTGVGHGTLFACVQPVFPWRAENPTCHRLARLDSVTSQDPWHVIELPHSVYRQTDLQQYLHSRQLGERLHELYDLDLDFARSDVLLSAVVTFSDGRDVTWFLMTSPHVPADCDCAGDAECVTSVPDKKGSVVFSRAQSSLQDGHVYFVCVRLSPRQSDPLTSDPAHAPPADVCGDGVVIDDTPPVGGSVKIDNARFGYLADSTQVTVSWSGFSDVESKVISLPHDVTLNYSVALGTYPGGEDISAFVSVGQRTSLTFQHLSIATGAACIATVKAEDRVGHVTEAWSEPVTVDNTPTVGRVAAGTITRENFVAGLEVPVFWEGVEDRESGIELTEVAVSSEGGRDDVIPFAYCHGNTAELTDTSALVDGHSYVVLLKVTNGAGLTSLMASAPFIMDSSSPSPGQVWNSAHNTKDHGSYSSDVGTYSVHWSGFRDPHSGLHYYRVGLGSQPQQTDIHPYIYVGQQTSYTWRRNFDQGKRYYVTVEACNKAGLCLVTSSPSMTFDDSRPTPGHVTVGLGGQHSKYFGHNSSLSVQWTGFTDPQTGIQDFRWCVGTAPKTCDVMPLTMTLLSRATVRAGLNLPVATSLYVTVRARNPAGLETVSVSDSFMVDLSPPEVLIRPHFLSPRDGHPTNNQWDRSVLRLAWQFEDPDSAVVRHTITIRSNLTGRLAVDSFVLGADKEVTLTLDSDHLLADGDTHYAAVTACNAASLCTMSVSDLLLVDSTPPVVGTLLSPLTGKKISASGDSTTRPKADNLTVDSITSTDVTGTLSSATADFTPPFAAESDKNDTSVISTLTPDITTDQMPTATTDGDGTAVPNEEQSQFLLDLMWHRFADAESGISAYYVMAGKAYNGEELSGGPVRVEHDSTNDIQRHTLTLTEVLTQGDVIYLTVWAENALGRHSPMMRMAFDVLQDNDSGTSGTLVAVRHSCDVAFCTQECTCAPTGQVCEETTAPCEQYDTDHPALGTFRLSAYMGPPSGPQTVTTSAKCLEGHWQLSDPRFMTNVSRFQWSFGLVNETAGEGIFDTLTEKVWYDVGRNTSAVHCLPGKRMLKSGRSYILHVRAWLSPQHRVTFLSAPVLADHTPPQIRRGLHVVESDVTCSTDVDYITTEPTVTACWNGVFRDEESAVGQYIVWIGTSPHADEHTEKIQVGLNTSWTFSTAALEQGTRYYVNVQAINGAGLMTSAVSDGVLVDATPPVAGVVFASHRYSHVPAQSSASTLPASWHGFQDEHSGLTSYHVALRDITDNTTAAPYTNVGIQNEYTLEGLNLQHNHRYKVVAKAKDKAGLESQPVESRAILIDVTPPEGVTCRNYILQEERNLSYTSTSSFVHDSYVAEFKLHQFIRVGLTPNSDELMNLDIFGSDELMKLELLGSNMATGAAGYVSVEARKMPIQFQYSQSGQATAQHVFMASGGENTTISVEVQTSPGSQIHARLYRCNDTSVSETESVTVQQTSQFSLSVCSQIRDNESGIRSLLIGIGTTPGGLQVRPLTPVGHTGHSQVDVELQHGLPVYATVHAENHAGQWSRFISQPATMDRTPPEVRQLRVALRYEGQQNGSEVWADVSWEAEDTESSVVSCTCSLDGQSSIEPSIHMTTDVAPGLCQWQLHNPQHGASVRATVSCVNGVQVHATETSRSAIVLLQPPDLSQTVVDSLSNNAIQSPFHASDLGVRSSDSSLEFCWHGVSDPTITEVHFRFLHESLPLTEWLPADVYKTSTLLERRTSKLVTGNVTLQVRAMNAMSMISSSVAASVLVDDTKPSLTGRSASAILTDGVLELTWGDVFTDSQDVVFALYAGTARDYGDVINHVVTEATSYRGMARENLFSIYVTIWAVQANGMSEVYREQLQL